MAPGGRVVRERDPAIIRISNSWLILNLGGGPTDDKPGVTLITPPHPNETSAFLNLRVADIHRAHEEWSIKGASFLTEPKDRGSEIRAFIRDPDGHLIEVGQAGGPGSFVANGLELYLKLDLLRHQEPPSRQWHVPGDPPLLPV
jgi:hypothetical protein